jgi:hypothetical protein
VVLGDWLAPPPSPRRALTVGYDTTRRVGTFTWPPVGTRTWPPLGTFSWPRTICSMMASRWALRQTCRNRPNRLQGRSFWVTSMPSGLAEPAPSSPALGAGLVILAAPPWLRALWQRPPYPLHGRAVLCAMVPRRTPACRWILLRCIETPPCLGVWGSGARWRCETPTHAAAHDTSDPPRQGRHRLPRPVGGKRRVNGPYPGAETPCARHARSTPSAGASTAGGRSFAEQAGAVLRANTRRYAHASEGAPTA